MCNVWKPTGAGVEATAVALALFVIKARIHGTANHRIGIKGEFSRRHDQITQREVASLAVDGRYELPVEASDTVHFDRDFCVGKTEALK